MSEINANDPTTGQVGKGLIVPLLTPFSVDGEQVDYTALRALVRFLVQSRVDGLMACGTTGEMPMLSHNERLRIVETVVDEAAGIIPVIVQTGAATTAEVIALTHHAQITGASAVAILTPYYYRDSDAALEAYYVNVSESVPDFPIFLYNIPQNTGNNLSPALVGEIVRRCPNVIGIKDSSGNLAQLIQDRAEVDRPFYTLVGSDRLILAAMANGVDGAVAGNANAMPEIFVGLLSAIKAGDWSSARHAQERATTAVRILKDGSDLSLFKGVLKRRGLPVGPVRAPLLTASDEDVDACFNELEAAGISLLPVRKITL